MIQLPQETLLIELALDRGTLAVSAWGGSRSAVYVYERQRIDPRRWQLTATLEVDPELRRGAGLALAGDTLVVGIPTRDKALVYTRAGPGWRRARTLRPPPGPRFGIGGFGASVSVAGPHIAVGAPGRNKVYVYGRNVPTANSWGLTSTMQGRVDAAGLLACLDGDEPAPGFGQSVALSGRILTVGATDGRNPTLPVPTIVGQGNRANGVYVFQQDRTSETRWRQQLDLAPAPGCSAFATSSVSLSGPRLLVDNTGGQLVDGLFIDQVEDDRWFVHERNHRGADRWGRRASLKAPDGLDFVYQAMVRGNVAALAGVGDSAAWVFDRDTPVRNRWGLLARLPFEAVDISAFPGQVAFTDAVAIGPREVVTAHPGPNVVQIFPRQPILADDFEVGDTSAWSGTRGAVEVVGPGLGGSSALLAVTVGGDGRASFVASNRPRREPSVSIGFTLQINNVDLAGRPVEILRLYAGKPVLRLRLEQVPFDFTYMLRLQARQRNGAWRGVGGIELHPDDEWPIAVEYRAPSATGAADGFARFDANGLDVRQARNLDMKRLLVNRVVLGLPVGSPRLGGGSFLIDDFEMHR